MIFVGPITDFGWPKMAPTRAILGHLRDSWDQDAVHEHKYLISLEFLMILKAIWELSGVIVGPSWAILGPSWGHLGPPWVHLGPSRDHLGAIFGHLGASSKPKNGRQQKR